MDEPHRIVWLSGLQWHGASAYRDRANELMPGCVRRLVTVGATPVAHGTLFVFFGKATRSELCGGER
jgi:hypothetical protein